jgi:hypothetical protein
LTNTYGYFSCTYKAAPGTTNTWYATVTKAGYQPGTSTPRTFKAT